MFGMDGLDAPFEASRGNAPDLIDPIVEDEAFLPPNEAVINQPGVDPAVYARILRPVLEDPDAYLMRRQAPFEGLPAERTEYSGLDFEGMDLHLQEEWEDYMNDDKPSMGDEEASMGDEEASMGDEDPNMGGEKASLDRGKSPSADADAMSSDSPKVEKRDDSITDNCRLMEAIGSSQPSFASIGLPGSTMPSDAPPSFVPVMGPHQ